MKRHRTDIGRDDGGHVDHDGDPDTEREPPPSTLERLGWFVLLWLAGVACVTVAGLVIRAAILP